jgi:hypothetical protein
MSETTQFTNTPGSPETGILNHQWNAIRFYFAKRAFESKLEGLLRAAGGHESNSLPPGDSRYRLLNAEADSLCTKFAERWGLAIDLLKARMAGLAKLERLSVQPQTRSYARLVCLGMVGIPLLCLLMGAVAGLVDVGFHLVGGR